MGFVKKSINDWIWRDHNESISFPGNVRSVVSTIVVKSDSAVVKEPVLDSGECWLTGHIWVPVLIEVNFQRVNDALGRVSLVIHLTSVNGLCDSAVSSNGAVGVGIQFRVVKLGWPGGVGTIVCAIVVEVDGTVVVHPEGNTCKT